MSLREFLYRLVISVAETMLELIPPKVWFVIFSLIGLGVGFLAKTWWGAAICWAVAAVFLLGVTGLPSWGRNATPSPPAKGPTNAANPRDPQ